MRAGVPGLAREPQEKMKGGCCSKTRRSISKNGKARGGLSVPPGEKRRRKTKMRKSVMMMALMTLLTLAVAGVAYADRIQGNDRNNTLFESRRNDTIFGYGGDDVIDANNYSGETDRGYGGSGDDRILVNDNDRLDAAVGDRGYDVCIVDARTEVGTGCNEVRIR